MAGSSTILEEKLVDSVIVRKGSSLPHSWRSRYMPRAIGEVSGSERRGKRANITEKQKEQREVQEQHRYNPSLSWLKARVQLR